LTPQSLRNYRRAVARILDLYGDHPAQMRPSQMQDFLIASYGDTVSSHRSALVILRGAYGDLVRDGLFDTSPLTHLQAPRPKAPSPHALTHEQIKLLLRTLRTSSSEARHDGTPVSYATVYSDIALLQYMIGARIGELGALRWRDVDLLDDRVVVRIGGTIVQPGGGYPVDRQNWKKTGQIRIMEIGMERSSDGILMLRRRRRDMGGE
jgi:integrase